MNTKDSSLKLEKLKMGLVSVNQIFVGIKNFKNANTKTKKS
jgi:hypothetical protein